MSRWRDLVLLVVLLAALPASAQSRFGFGRAPTQGEIAAWDIDVRPDGHGVRAGRGTVTHGQEIYDTKCATCHGTFGESNQYMVIAGGVRTADLKSGRAAGLRSPDVVRTLGNKLNYATTLWDYINRAMPWTAPQSLSVDEVYAVTAYVLYLNEIVPAEFELTNENLLMLKMPNRDGLTRQHGMGSVAAKPDVQGSSCLHDCGPEPKITSQIPVFALNDHGNLRAQFRAIGPLATIDSAQRATRPVQGAPRSDSHGSAREILARHACTSCHGFDSALGGPAFKDIALRYRDRGDAATYLLEKIRKGGAGAWGTVPMPGQTTIKEDEVITVVQWIISGPRDGE